MTDIENSVMLSTRNWDEDVFCTSRVVWDELLVNSDADPLFLSWNWLYSWWTVPRAANNRLCIMAVYEHDKLVALAPLYVERDTYFRGLLPTSRIQFIGKRYKGKVGVRAEYMDFIIRKGYRHTALPTLLDALSSLPGWSELSLEDFNTGSANYPIVKNWLTRQGWHGRVDAKGSTFIVDCTGNFENYLKSLGKNSRLKLFNRRKLLEERGRVDLEFINESNHRRFLELLDKWHIRRWGSPVFDKETLTFFEQTFNSSKHGLSIRYSNILTLNGVPLSVLVNADRGGKIYNIQLGFIEDFDKKIALGTLHIGYMLEHAFSEDRIRSFDFLEGKGKNTNYKCHLAKEGPLLESSRWFARRPLKPVFQFYDRFLRSP